MGEHDVLDTEGNCIAPVESAPLAHLQKHSPPTGIDRHVLCSGWCGGCRSAAAVHQFLQIDPVVPNPIRMVAVLDRVSGKTREQAFASSCSSKGKSDAWSVKGNTPKRR